MSFSRLLPIFMGFFFVAPLFLFSSNAEAVQMFSKKYSAPCTLCHSSWPILNKVGWKFKINGFQLPDENDGAERGKESPAFNLHFDRTSLPIGLRFTGGVKLLQPSRDINGNKQSDDMACCTEKNTLKLYAAGTVAKDSAYYISYPLDQNRVNQAYIRFVNMFGQGFMGFDLGALRTADFDTVVSGREWFAMPNPAVYGNGSIRGGDIGLTSSYEDTGFRIYGNPGYGLFSYEFLYVTGARKTGESANTKGRAVSFMGRMDLDKFSGSIRYWTNESGEVDFWRDNSSVPFIATVGKDVSGKTTKFVGDSNTANEETADYLVGLKYETLRWQAEFVYNYNTFKVGSRTSGSDTYSRGSVKRTGMGLAGIYRLSPLITFGGRYSVSTVGSYNEQFNSVTTIVPEATASFFEFKVQLTPIQNGRLSLQFNLDNSNAAARTNENGDVFSSQNKVLLQWDWAI